MHNLTLFFFLAVGCCANTFASAAIVAPYSNDFSASVADFSPTLSGQWSLISGKYQNQIIADMIPGNESSSSTRQFLGLGGSPFTAKDFSLSTVFTITNSVGDFNSLGYAILANNADATTNANSFYLADVYVGGGAFNAQMRFAEIGVAPTLATTMFNLNKVLLQGIPYLLQVEGKYAANGDLNLKLELTGDNDYDFLQLPPIPAINVLAGDYFGYRDRTGTTTSSLTVEYDSLNVTAIPEPSAIGLVAASLLGGYAIGRYWRRRQSKIDA